MIQLTLFQHVSTTSWKLENPSCCRTALHSLCQTSTRRSQWHKFVVTILNAWRHAMKRNYGIGVFRISQSVLCVLGGTSKQIQISQKQINMKSLLAAGTSEQVLHVFQISCSICDLNKLYNNNNNKDFFHSFSNHSFLYQLNPRTCAAERTPFLLRSAPEALRANREAGFCATLMDIFWEHHGTYSEKYGKHATFALDLME